MAEINPLQAAADAIDGTPSRPGRLRLPPNRKELIPDGAASRRSVSIMNCSAAARRDTCARSTETSPSQVLSLPRTGGRETPSLPGGIAGAGTWAGDSTSPAQSTPGSATILALPQANGDTSAASSTPSISPADAARRQGGAWGPLAGEVIQITQLAMFAAQVCAPIHLPTRLSVASVTKAMHSSTCRARACAT